MTREQVQRLLGGYATNSLTEAERKALFDAALDDQELFDALQNEQALKDLLDDEITHSQVRAALEGRDAASASRSRGRWWVWGLAGGLAAAVSVVVLTTYQPSPKPVQMAIANKPMSAEGAAPAPKPAPAPPRPSEMMAKLARREMERKVEGKRSAKEELTHGPLDRKDLPAPPPPASPAPASEPAPVAGQSQQSALQLEKAQKDLSEPSQDANALRDRQGAALGQPRAVRGGIGGGIAGLASTSGSLKSPGLSYSVLKRDENGGFSKVDPNAKVRQGDAVRLVVSPPMSGHLNLYERDSNGLWKPIPLAASQDGSAKVNANTPYVVPDQPIDVKDQEQLRLVLSPEPAVADALKERSAARAKKSVAIEPQTTSRAPQITVDITLTGK
jgi:hypothetical protein